MHSTPAIRDLILWLAQLPPSVWWHLGGTELKPRLYLQSGHALEPPAVPGLRLKFLDAEGVKAPIH